MAATVSSLGPPSVGPGNSAKTVGFAVSATARPGVYSNREPLSGNTLCHKNDIERKYAIHENRLASVKASLSPSSPTRLEFMDKRLSKNFHIRRHHEHLVYENLKLLRALEEIHSRGSSNVGGAASGKDTARGWGGSTAGRAAASSIRGGGRSGSASGSLTVPGTSNRGKGEGGSGFGGSKLQSKKLNTLLARKRIVRAAVVARENQKMLQRLTQSKSLYSRETMRKHRKRHQRVLRLRKTDYTAGHLLAATTAMKHWTGGDARDDGFSYSFEEGRHRRHRTRALPNRRTPATINRGPSCSPIRGTQRSVNTAGTGSMSAPHLPGILDVGDFYGGGNMQGSPLDRSLFATGGDGRGKGNVGGTLSALSSAYNGDESDHSNIMLRSSTEVGVVGDGSITRPSTGGGIRAGKSFYSAKKDPENTASAACDSTGGTRGTDGSVDTLPHRKTWSGSNDEGGGGLGGGSTGRYGRIFQGDGSTGGTQPGRGGAYGSLGGERTESSDLDMIFNPLAFPDEKEGVRVLIQATKPLEVLNHAGETWICFIRIMAKDPFDGQLDIRIIHDRQEVCRRLLSVDEANKICERADNAVALREGSLAGKTSYFSGASPAEANTPLQSPSPSSIVAAPAGDHSVQQAAGCPLPHGLRRASAIERNLNDLLEHLFKEADTKGKGYLTPEELTSIMHHAELGLTGPELQLVIAEADENADGTIDYYEFIPMAHNLVHAFRARRRACVEMRDESLDLDQQAIHELYDAEFERMVKQLKELCKSFDPDDKGVVPRADFKQCISADRCGGLTKIESKLLLNLMPKDSQGNVVYQKLGAGLEQVRFTTLRNTVAEAAATDTQKYLMDLCREEDAKSDPLGSKPHLKNSADATITIGGKQYSGVLRARQLTKLLLNAPLLSLSRLHVTALMSQAHIVDGMVNYVQLVPMMTKTIEGIFDPRSLKMRHDIFKDHEGGGAGSGVGGAMQQQGAATVLGKTRDDIQKLFMDVLRDENVGSGIERLKDPKTFAKCMTSLGLNLEPDIINALWETANLDGREGTTFVDVVDFCFNCVLFLEREKQVKTLQRTITSGSASQSSSKSGWGVAAVAAAATGSGEVPTEKLDPLLNLARALVRHAKVTSPAESKVGLEFLDNSQIDGALATDHQVNVGGDNAGNNADGPRGTSLDNNGTTTLSSEEEDDEEDTIFSDDGVDDNFGKKNEAAGVGTVSRCGSTDPLAQLRSTAPDATTLVRIRRRVPVVGPAGQPISTTSARGRMFALSVYHSGAAAAQAPPRSKDNASSQRCGVGEETSCATADNDRKAPHGVESTGSVETEAASRFKTRGMIVRVYWEGTARDRVYVEVYSAKMESGKQQGSGVTGNTGNYSGSRRCLRLGVRVPTLAVVDAQAAAKFAERVAQQVTIQVGDARSSIGAEQQQSTRLRLGAVDAKAVVAGN